MTLPAPAEVARLEEARQATGTAEVALASEPLAGGWLAWGGPGAWANQACGLGLAGPVSEAELDRLVAFYVERGCEPKLAVCPFAHENLVAGLARRGFTLREFTNVLARDLAAPWSAPAVAGLELVPVDPADAAAVERFVEVSTSGFRPEGEPLSPVLRELTARVVRHPLSRSVLALVDGQPAGGASCELRGGCGGLFGASVLPPFRRRGVQAALLAWRLDDLRARGARLVTIQSTPGIPTERNAARLGFRPVYTKVYLALAGPGLAVSS